jgi:hypothetical protein
VRWYGRARPVKSDEGSTSKGDYTDDNYDKYQVEPIHGGFSFEKGKVQTLKLKRSRLTPSSCEW